MLINKRENTDLKHLNYSEDFIEYSNDMNDFYKKMEEYNPKKKQNINCFNDMIAVRLSNKKLNPIVTELFNKRRKLHIYLVFIPQSCFYEPKNIILNSTRYFTMEIQKRRTSATLY